MTINIAILKKDGLQLREALSEDTVAEYAEAMRNGAKFPPVIVFFDQKTREYYLADGFHRVEAAQRAGLTGIEAEQRIGDYYAAEAYACGANSVLPRSSETKKRCVMRLWEHREAHFGKKDPSDREIANLAKLPRSTVKTIISQLARVGQLQRPPTVTGKDGVTRTIPTRTAPPVRPLPPSRPPVKLTPPVPQPPVKKGYHVGTDGKTHADGVLLDRFHVEIPERLASAFNDSRLNDWARTVSAVKCAVQQAREAGDPIAAKLQRCEIELGNAYHELKAAAPFCICRMCQGQGCQACADTGFQTEDQYNRNPSEFKA